MVVEPKWFILTHPIFVSGSSRTNSRLALLDSKSSMIKFLPLTGIESDK